MHHAKVAEPTDKLNEVAAIARALGLRHPVRGSAIEWQERRKAKQHGTEQHGDPARAEQRTRVVESSLLNPVGKDVVATGV